MDEALDAIDAEILDDITPPLELYCDPDTISDGLRVTTDRSRELLLYRSSGESDVE